MLTIKPELIITASITPASDFFFAGVLLAFLFLAFVLAIVLVVGL